MMYPCFVRSVYLFARFLLVTLQHFIHPVLFRADAFTTFRCDVDSISRLHTLGNIMKYSLDDLIISHALTDVAHAR